MKYSEYAPTGFDIKGLSLPDRQDWIVAGGHNRDSGILEESNFYSMLRELGEESETVEVHRFGHWACGWLEIILVDPRRKNDVQPLLDALEDYPILDESDYSRREYDAACEAWDRSRLHDRVELCKRHNCSIFAARRDEIPQNDNGGLFQELVGH